MINREFYKNVRNELMQNVKENSIVILLSGTPIRRSEDAYYDFHINRNFFYLTGVDAPNLKLVMTKKDGLVKSIMFIEKNDEFLAKWVGNKISKEEVEKLSGVDEVRYLENFDGFLNYSILEEEYQNIYFDFGGSGKYEKYTEVLILSREIKEKYPMVVFNDVYNKICNMRKFKRAEEVECTLKAIEITKNGIENIFKNAKSGMNECEIEAHFNFSLENEGCKEKAFGTIVASGKNGTILHYEDNNCDIKDGDLVLLDLGAAYNHYSGDISRTFPVNGKFTERQKQVYNAVLKAMEEVEKAAKPGINLRELNEVAKKYLTIGCKELGLIKEDNEISKYYYHGISHLLGLDTHDVGYITGESLKPGMIITNEPGLYIEEEGIGIRIEDDLLITENGCKNLSSHIVKSVEEIEKFMQK